MALEFWYAYIAIWFQTAQSEAWDQFLKFLFVCLILGWFNLVSTF